MSNNLPHLSQKNNCFLRAVLEGIALTSKFLTSLIAGVRHPKQGSFVHFDISTVDN